MCVFVLLITQVRHYSLLLFFDAYMHVNRDICTVFFLFVVSNKHIQIFPLSFSQSPLNNSVCMKEKLRKETIAIIVSKIFRSFL